jgi:plastocyanin
MQVPKRHLPIVGLLGLVVIAAAGGSIYYYAYLHPPCTPCGVPSHRLFFMTATIFEAGGFQIVNGAYLNQTDAPSFNATSGPSLLGVKHQNYTASGTTINAIVGDTVTLYIRGVNSTDPNQILNLKAHGFSMAPYVSSGVIPLGKWYSVTFTVNQAGTFPYFCTITCSPKHYLMSGNMVVSSG